MVDHVFHEGNFGAICKGLAQGDEDLKKIMDSYGYPQMWTRPNSFATLVLIILEQQVSLQSAYAAYNKLSQKIKKITPQNLLQLTEEELRQCYFSRQKIGYVRGLATALTSQSLDLKKMALLPDDAIRTELVSLKGIGDWTVDIYLLHAMQRLDVFPLGDLALVKAIKEIKGLTHATKEELIDIGDRWRPHRSIATMMLWHYYLQKRGIQIIH